MHPKQFPESNQTFTLPEDACLDRPDRGELPVCIDPESKQIVSCWQLSPEEIEVVKNTGEIWLGMIGMQPPVWLSVERPFAQPEMPDEEAFAEDLVLEEKEDGQV